MTIIKNRTLLRCLYVVIVSAVVVTAGQSGYGAVKVYPRLFTPGGAAENNRIFFEYDYSDEPKPTLKIFDLRGRNVKDISAMNPRAIASGWLISWDGKDDNGETAMPGVYIYQWTEGETVIKGAIVVAR